MPHILVADKIAEEGLALMREAADVTFDVRHGLSPEELGKVASEYDGMLIRSGVQVTKETLAHPGRLTAIARAGVGVDNVDLEAATAAGVLVLNTPDANTISTAEHTVAMMLALHRRIPDAHVHVCSGQWKRGDYQGDQLAGKTLGIVGFGRVGRAVAKRALAFDMNVLVHDPFVNEQTARDQSVSLVADLTELLRRADCVTLHAALTDTTQHMIGVEQIAAMKAGAKLVNCARGSLVDEAALVEALNAGRLSGAALDVYEHEPPKGSPLLSARNVVLTPHLAASTVEAQAQVSVEAVEALLAYLRRGEVRSAVNVTGMPKSFTPWQRAFVDLCSRMGMILSPWCGGGVDRISVTVCGERLEELGGPLSWQAMVSMMKPHLGERLNIVNAREKAEYHGIQVDHVIESRSAGAFDSLRIAVQGRGEKHEIEGTIFADLKPRVMAIDGYRMEMVPERSMALIFNDDRPGVIGLVGQKVGDAGINIADMVLSRRGKMALMVLKLDEPMPADLRNALQACRPPILSLRTVDLPPTPDESATA
jgi:D-3-phosphoglycerate dehydrogenase / 2-oxoglutarate reductase